MLPLPRRRKPSCALVHDVTLAHVPRHLLPRWPGSGLRPHGHFALALHWPHPHTVLGPDTHVPTGCLVAPAHPPGAFMMHAHVGRLWKENRAGHLPPSCSAYPAASARVCCFARSYESLASPKRCTRCRQGPCFLVFSTPSHNCQGYDNISIRRD